MRALIRDLKTGRFYAPVWQWTHRREKACDFGSTFQALTFAGDSHLHGVEVVLMSDEPGHMTRIHPELEGPSLKFYGVRHGK